jgi:hypothetical protein
MQNLNWYLTDQSVGSQTMSILNVDEHRQSTQYPVNTWMNNEMNWVEDKTPIKPTQSLPLVKHHTQQETPQSHILQNGNILTNKISNKQEPEISLTVVQPCRVRLLHKKLCTPTSYQTNSFCCPSLTVYLLYRNIQTVIALVMFVSDAKA